MTTTTKKELAQMDGVERYAHRNGLTCFVVECGHYFADTEIGALNQWARGLNYRSYAEWQEKCRGFGVHDEVEIYEYRS